MRVISINQMLSPRNDETQDEVIAILNDKHDYHGRDPLDQVKHWFGKYNDNLTVLRNDTIAPSDIGRTLMEEYYRVKEKLPDEDVQPVLVFRHCSDPNVRVIFSIEGCRDCHEGQTKLEWAVARLSDSFPEFFMMDYKLISIDSGIGGNCDQIDSYEGVDSMNWSPES